jgi:hypothetical protein
MVDMAGLVVPARHKIAIQELMCEPMLHSVKHC